MMTVKQISTNHPVGRALAFQSSPPKAAINADDKTALIDAARDSVEYHKGSYDAGQENDDAEKAAWVENSFAHVLQITTETAVCNGY